MATRSKTPSTPAKRSKNTSDQGAAAAAPARAKAKRNGSVSAPEASAEQAVQEQVFEAPPDHAEQPAAAAEAQSPGASVGGGDRAGRALDAIKTLGEMIAEGIGALAELRSEMREMSGRLDQLAAGMPKASQAEPDGQPRAEAADAADYQVGRDRDPGDAVPPGVAVMSPTPLDEADEAALHSLEELPKRAGRGKRGPRAKA